MKHETNIYLKLLRLDKVFENIRYKQQIRIFFVFLKALYLVVAQLLKNQFMKKQ